MKRFSLGIGLAILAICGTGCHWNHCCFPYSPYGNCGGCGDCGDCGSCGDCCDPCGSCCDPCGGCCGPFGGLFSSWAGCRPGGCGEFYWGDWCTGNPHCSTCDQCANWIGPPSPGGHGAPPEVYGKAHPYGYQVASHNQMHAPSRNYVTAPQTMMARRSTNMHSTPANRTQVARQTSARPTQVVRQAPSRPTQQVSHQVVRPTQHAPQTTAPAARTTSRASRQPSPRVASQMPQNSGRGEYEGAIEVLGVTDRVVKTAEEVYAEQQSQQPTLADAPTGTSRR